MKFIHLYNFTNRCGDAQSTDLTAFYKYLKLPVLTYVTVIDTLDSHLILMSITNTRSKERDRTQCHVIDIPDSSRPWRALPSCFH